MGGDIGSPMGDYGDRAAEASEKLGNYQDDWRDREIDRLCAREQELLAERESYQSTIDMLGARVARLEMALNSALDYAEHDMDIEDKILNEHPRQSVSEIQAQALERAARYYRAMIRQGLCFPGPEEPADFMCSEANRIREQTKEQDHD